MNQPRKRWPSQLAMTRREFLNRSLVAAAALPSAGAILSACSNPKEEASRQQFQVARPDNPVTLPLFEDNPPIEDNLPPEEGATVKFYGWADTIWKKVLGEFCDQNDCDYEFTSYTTMSEGLQKMSTGQVADVFFPDVAVIGKLVNAKRLQPLNHTYLPNIDNVWPVLKSPFYDQEGRYTVPWVVYTTGVAYRRDAISDEDAASQGYDLIWNSEHAGKVGIYDDYREAIGMALLRRGITDVNTGDPAAIEQAKNDLIDLIDLVDIRVSYNGAYAKLPAGVYDVHQGWSGDMIGGQWYLDDLKTPGTADVLGYWYPDDRKGVVNSNTIAIPATAEHPVLAHRFLNFLLSEKYGFENFTWLGYQPPFNSMNPDTLIKAQLGEYSPLGGPGTVPPSVPKAIVAEGDFNVGYRLLELDPKTDTLWQNAWDDFIAGARG
jgi:spermidine/putrescine transport system substrate-binding protein